jgi:hypothetical protein
MEGPCFCCFAFASFGVLMCVRVRVRVVLMAGQKFVFSFTFSLMGG